MKVKDNKVSVYKGKKLTVEIFGASHDLEIGVSVEGLKGEKADFNLLKDFMDRRKAKNKAYSTKRLEEDVVVVKEGYDGAFADKFVAVIENKNQISADYKNVVKIPRPSHADFVAWSKYGDNFDYRGGGKFSGRMTAPMCIAGGLIKQILSARGIEINAYISQIGKIKGKSYLDFDPENFDFKGLDKDFPLIDPSFKNQMDEQILSASANLDSVGGVIDCVITGVPIGSGEYMFDSIEGAISSLAFAVPAVKGIEFGAGFSLAEMLGSQANDCFYKDNDRIKTKTNNNGGINGGMANGMPITFRVVVKPTPSIGKAQQSINLESGENVSLKIQGRHDACIVPRAVPVVEAISAIAIYDLL